jgi:hypothetical protein
MLRGGALNPKLFNIFYSYNFTLVSIGLLMPQRTKFSTPTNTQLHYSHKVKKNFVKTLVKTSSVYVNFLKTQANVVDSVGATALPNLATAVVNVNPIFAKFFSLT